MRKNHLTKYEQETILNFNRADQDAVIYTHDPKLKRRLAEYAARHPGVAHLEFRNEYGGESYIIDKRRVSIRLTAPYSEKRIRSAREFVRQNGRQAQ